VASFALSVKSAAQTIKSLDVLAEGQGLYTWSTTACNFTRHCRTTVNAMMTLCLSVLSMYNLNFKIGHVTLTTPLSWMPSVGWDLLRPIFTANLKSLALPEDIKGGSRFCPNSACMTDVGGSQVRDHCQLTVANADIRMYLIHQIMQVKPRSRA